MGLGRRAILTWFLPLLLLAATAGAGDAGTAGNNDASPTPTDGTSGEVAIQPATGDLEIDGDLSDPGWVDATRVETWYETNPGDNLTPRVANVGWLTYDDRALYAAFRFADPRPGAIRAPLSDRDNLGGETDYGGIIVDTRNDHRTGILLLANPRGVQYDAVTDDSTGNEDSSLDLHWESAARVTAEGWELEIRVPFSSLRYGDADPQTWGIMLYRNWPREFRYQMFSVRLPRGSNCFICRSAALTGLTGLPGGGHVILAPYVTAARTSVAPEGAGSPLRDEPVDGEVGADLKWLPSADHAVDLTVNPDFSQVESDVAQIEVNERFALFYPERRPFFLEGLELFSTPVQAVYTRSITAPRWGARGTGKVGKTAYTVLAGSDDGGGVVILPGPSESDFADQDFRSKVAIARVRRDLGRSFVSVLATDREIDGGGHNRVLGPDFQWRPDESFNLTGQLLWSDSRTPGRPDLAAEWDGRRLDGHAGDVRAIYNSTHLDLYAEYTDIADGFRADLGFVPQVGIREGGAEAGWTFRPHGLLNRVRVFAFSDRSEDRDRNLVFRDVSAGTGFNGRKNLFARLRYADERVASGGRTFPRRRFYYTAELAPGRVFARVSVDGVIGEDVDFDGHRPGDGGSVALGATVRPTDRLDLQVNAERRWLDVAPDGGGERQRLFTAEVSRLRATYNLSARAFVRAIGQWVETSQDPVLAGDPAADARTGSFSGSLLFSYKLNWQSVLFVGYGDGRELDPVDDLAPVDRQLFVKLSYAFQR